MLREITTSQAYHVSEIRNFPGDLSVGSVVMLKPSIPKTSPGEDSRTPRVSFCEQVDWCFNVLPGGIDNGQIFYVFKPVSPKRLIVTLRADDDAAESDPNYDNTWKSGIGGRYGYEHDLAHEQEELWSIEPIRCEVIDIVKIVDWNPVSIVSDRTQIESLIRELGYGSGRYTAAFTHPDPMDPNDRKRQQTQSRDTEFPYDMPVSYGQPESPSMDGSKYQDGGYGGQLTPWFMPDDDGDIKKDEAIGTPYNFKQSDGGTMGGTRPPGGSRGFAGSTQDDLDLPDNEVFGEGDLRDLQTGELRDFMGSVAMEPPELAECFAVYNDSGDETLSLLERLDWDGDRY